VMQIKSANNSDKVTIKVPTNTTGTFIYSLVSVVSGGTLGCSQAQTGNANVTVESVPFAPKVTIVQPTCTVAGSITVTNPIGTGIAYSIDGIDYSNTSGVFNNLNAGNYIVTYKIPAGCVSLEAPVKINDNGKPVPTPKDGTICVDATGNVVNPYTIDANLNDINYTFVWTNNGSVVGSNSTFEATVPGDYTVVATNKVNGCVSDPVTVTVNKATNPVLFLSVSEAFSSDNTVTVNASPAGNYSYQLDNGPIVSTNIFHNVSQGDHIVTVYTDACIPVTLPVTIIDYPNFFTPNGDGIHDTWNIDALSNQNGVKINIFDRYGNLSNKLVLVEMVGMVLLTVTTFLLQITGSLLSSLITTPLESLKVTSRLKDKLYL